MSESCPKDPNRRLLQTTYERMPIHVHMMTQVRPKMEMEWKFRCDRSVSVRFCVLRNAELIHSVLASCPSVSCPWRLDFQLLRPSCRCRHRRASRKRPAWTCCLGVLGNNSVRVLYDGMRKAVIEQEKTESLDKHLKTRATLVLSAKSALPSAPGYGEQSLSPTTKSERDT
jgi:hypothetical protein